MPNAILVSVADAVTAELNDAAEGTFSQRFLAERSYADWELPLEDADPRNGTVLLDVVPVGINYLTDIVTPASISYGPAVDLVVRLRLGPERREANGRFTLAEIDDLVYFVEQLNEFFVAGRLLSFQDAAWDSEIGNKILAAYVPSHLRQYHQFTGRVRIPFVVQQDL